MKDNPADTLPLDKAVNREVVKILLPMNKKPNENKPIPFIAISKTSLFPFAKMPTRSLDRVFTIIKRITDDKPIK